MLSILLVIGIVSIVISGIALGALTGGQQQRANFHSETKEHSEARNKIALYSGIVGVICLVVAGILYFV